MILRKWVQAQQAWVGKAGKRPTSNVEDAVSMPTTSERKGALPVVTERLQLLGSLRGTRRNDR